MSMHDLNLYGNSSVQCLKTECQFYDKLEILHYILQF